MSRKSAALEPAPLPSSSKQEETDNLLAEMDKIVEKLEKKGKTRGLDDWAKEFSNRMASHAKPVAKKK
jgi:hypothetical protein